MVEIQNKNSTSYKETVWIGLKRISKSFKRKTDAQKWKREVEVGKTQGNFIHASQQSNLCFKEVANRWLEEKVKSKNGAKTFEEYSLIVKKHFNPTLGIVSVSKLTIKDGYKLINGLREKNLSPSTINKVIGVLKQIAKFAQKNKMIRESPFAEIELLLEPERDYAFFDKAEITKILAACLGTEMHGFIVMALNTGMRIGEILGIKWDMVNLDQGFISIARKQTRRGLEEFTKTKRIRKVGINPELRFELLRLKRQNPFSNYVLTRENGKPYSPDHFCARKYKAILEKAEVRSLRFHDLRHTFASHFMMNGGNIFELQKILGHSKIEMTMRYAHLSEDHLLKAACVVGFSGEQIHSQKQVVAKLSPQEFETENKLTIS